AGRPGLGQRRAERRRCDSGSEQAQWRVRTARPDAARADRRDRRARARTHPHRQLMTDEGRNQSERRRQLRRKTDRKVTAGSKLDLILDVTRRLMSITDLDALLRDMATVTTQLLEADRATIFLVDRERGGVWSKVALEPGAGEIRQAIGVGIAGLVAATGDTVNIPDAYDDPRFNPEPDQRTGYRTKSLLTFPMTGQNERVIGVFQVVNKNGGGEFTADDEETLSSLGASAAVAVELAHLVFPQDMREVPVIAAQHHERMDGKGYPRGLPAERILLGARIVAAADVFDALTAPRYYKPAYTLEKTLEIMDGMAGDHLDPAGVGAVQIG